MQKFEKFDIGDLLPESLNLLRGYSFSDFIVDAKSGALLSLLSLPLVIAYATAAGLTPEIGLTTCVMAGLVSFFFGGGKYHIVCPTGSFIVIVGDIIHKYGYEFLTHCTVLAGIILIISALFRCGNFARHIPTSVANGFRAGIGILLIVQQVSNILEIGCSGNVIHRIYFYITHMAEINGAALVVGLALISFLIFIRKNFPKAPASLMVLLLGAAISCIFPGALDTVGSRFQMSKCSINISPVVLSCSWTYFWKILPHAAVIAFLAAINSLLGAITIDELKKTKHKNNAELISLGFANMLTGFLCMMPSTCAISMSSVNARSAKSSMSVLAHSFFVFLMMTCCSEFVRVVPLCCFAAIVIPFGFGMIDRDSFSAGGTHHKITFGLTAIVSIFTNVVTAVIAGLIFHHFSKKKYAVPSAKDDKGRSKAYARVINS